MRYFSEVVHVWPLEKPLRAPFLEARARLYLEKPFCQLFLEDRARLAA